MQTKTSNRKEEPSIIDKKAFLDYLTRTFGPMSNHFTYGMAENVIDYAVETCGSDPHQLAAMLVKLIPELRPDEAAPYIEWQQPVQTGLFAEYAGHANPTEAMEEALENTIIDRHDQDPDADGEFSKSVDTLIFLHGHCGPFALALNRITGWPIEYTADNDRADDGNPMEWLCHAWCVPVPGKAYADVRGITGDRNLMLEAFEDFIDLPGDTFHAEPDDLRRHLSSFMGEKNLDDWITAATSFIRDHQDWFAIAEPETKTKQKKGRRKPK